MGRQNIRRYLALIKSTFDKCNKSPSHILVHVSHILIILPVSMTITEPTMTSCLPGADSGGSQGSAGLASLNESVASVNASPVLSPNETGGVPNSGTLNFSATSLCNSSAASTTASMASAASAGNELSAAAAAAAQLNLSDCDPARLAAAGLPYPRLSSGLGSMYSAAAAAATYPSNDQNPYPSIAMADNFYGSLVRLRVHFRPF